MPASCTSAPSDRYPASGHSSGDSGGYEAEGLRVSARVCRLERSYVGVRGLFVDRILERLPRSDPTNGMTSEQVEKSGGRHHGDQAAGSTMSAAAPISNSRDRTDPCGSVSYCLHIGKLA